MLYWCEVTHLLTDMGTIDILIPGGIATRRVRTDIAIPRPAHTSHMHPSHTVIAQAGDHTAESSERIWRSTGSS